jgi:TRAP-type mannitol/chloroaromatic compound transport system permease small subunit
MVRKTMDYRLERWIALLLSLLYLLPFVVRY